MLEQHIQQYFGITKESYIQNVVSLFKTYDLSKKDFLILAGKPCNTLSFIQTGLLRMFKKNK